MPEDSQRQDSDVQADAAQTPTGSADQPPGEDASNGEPTPDPRLDGDEGDVEEGELYEPDFSDAGAGLDPASLRISELEQQLSELQARLRAVSAAYQNQQDEVEKVRQRLERQAAVKEEMRRGEVVVSLFDPVEGIKRAVENARKGASVEDTAKGLELVLNQFMEAFRKLGLEEVPGKGARFDPNLHEALTTIPVTDPALDDVVIDVFSAGYRIGGRVVTPARVVVGRLVDAAGEA